MVFQRIA